MLTLSRGRKGALAAGTLIAVYFFARTRLGLRAQFTHDDLMNCWRGVSEPLPQLLADCLLFFRPSEVFRPLGGLLYRAAFGVSGFDLFPLRVLLMILMGLTVVLVYCFSRRLSTSREVAILAALLASYHGNFWAFYFNTGQLYDILCCFFYFAALVYYLRVRQEGRFLRWHELLILCALYAAALDSKELAVSLPVVITVWELVFYPPSWRPSEFTRWARAGLFPALLIGLMTTAYIWGRVITPKGLGVARPAFHPDYSWGAAIQTISGYLNELFYATDYFDAKKTVALLLLLLVAAGLARSRTLLLCWVLFVAGILPMAFIPSRVLASVWIPVIGLLIYASVSAAALRDELLRLARRPCWEPAGQVILFLLAAWLVTQQDGLQERYRTFLPEYNSIRVIRQSFARLCPRMPEGSTVLIVRDPLNGSCSTDFLVRLMYGDYHAVVDQRFRYTQPTTRADAMRYKFVFDYEGGKLVRLDPAAYAASLPVGGGSPSTCCPYDFSSRPSWCK